MSGETPYTLLIVDDETSITRSLERLFRREGYRILTAQSGAEGLEILQEECRNVALIISDQRMPGMSGAQFLEKAKAVAPDAVRFLLTGYSDMNAVIQAVNDGGIHRYLTKPWNDDGLLLHVRHSLEHYELLNENRRLTELTAEQNRVLKDLNKNLEQKVSERTREIQIKNRALLEINRMLEGSIMDAVRMLTALVERLSPKLNIHLREVARLARQTARVMGLGEAAQDRVEMAGMVHDIGLLGMPDALWTKDIGTMNKEQAAAFSAHPVTTAIILENVERLAEVGEIVLCHHEQVDGKGFPNSLRGEQIPMESRIIAVVAEYSRIKQSLPMDIKKLIKTAQRYLDADTVNRLNRQNDPGAVIQELAEKIILLEANRKFDVNVTMAFIKTIGGTKTMDAVQTIDIEDLTADMVLMEDLRTFDGRLLLTKGTPLKEKLVRSIKTIAAREMIPARMLVSMPAAGAGD